MAKFKGGFGINADAAISADPGDVQVGYTGPVPPAGPYRGILKRMELVKTGPNSKNPGTPMLKLLVEIKEPKDSQKATYNTYGMWNNQMITEQSAPFVNQILNSLVGGDEKKFNAVKSWFWNGQLNTEKADGGHIHSIGKLKINSPDAEIPVIVNTKKAPARGDYPERLEINRWLVPSDDEKANNSAFSDEPEDDELGDELAEDEFDDGDVAF